MGFGYAVYFTERARNRVIRWDPDSGQASIVAGEPADGDPSQTLMDPYGLAFDSGGNLLIADKLHDRICRLRSGKLESLPLRDMDGHRARLPVSHPSYNPLLITPTGLFTENTGTLVAAFSDDHTIYRIHGDGRIELILGRVRNRSYHFGDALQKVSPSQVNETPIYGPTGVVERSDGTVFFIERGRQLVREYHPSKGLRSVFPLDHRFAWSNRSTRVWREPPEAGQIGEYHPAFPGGLALDADETLYLTDVWHGCVLKLDLKGGRYTRVIHLARRTDQKQRGPAAIAFGADGTAWILDAVSNSVQGFDTSPKKKGPWQPIPNRLSKVGGEQLKLPAAGSGIALGQ